MLVLLRLFKRHQHQVAHVCWLCSVPPAVLMLLAVNDTSSWRVVPLDLGGTAGVSQRQARCACTGSRPTLSKSGRRSCGSGPCRRPEPRPPAAPAPTALATPPAPGPPPVHPEFERLDLPLTFVTGSLVASTDTHLCACCQLLNPLVRPAIAMPCHADADCSRNSSSSSSSSGGGGGTTRYLWLVHQHASARPEAHLLPLSEPLQLRRHRRRHHPAAHSTMHIHRLRRR
jgi:hypothetical protein